MKLKELIDATQNLPQDYEVKVAVGEDTHPIESVGHDQGIITLTTGDAEA